MIAGTQALSQARDQSVPLSERSVRRLAKIGISIAPRRGEALVYVSSGGASGEIVIVAQPGEPDAELISDLNEALPGLAGKGLKEHDSGVYVGRWRKSELWLMDSQITLPLRDLNETLKQHGMEPTFVLRSGSHVQTSQELRAESTWTSWRLFLLRDLKSDLALSASISGWDLAGLIFFLAWPFVITMAGLAAGWRHARQRDLDPGQKIRFYKSFVFGALAFAVVPHALFAFPYMASGRLNLFSDLWLGGEAINSFAFLLILLPVLLLSLLSGPINKLEKEKFGPEPEIAVLVDARLPSFEAVVKRHKLIQNLVLGLHVILGFLMLSHGLSTDQTGWTVAGLGLTMGFIVFVGESLPRALDPRSKASIPELADAQSAVNRMAARLGIDPLKVVPEVRRRLGRSLTVNVEGRLLAVNPSFVVSYAPDEQEYWLARSLVIEQKGSYQLGRLWATGALTLVLGLILPFAVPQLGWGSLAIVSILPAIAIISMRFNGKNLRDANVEAVLLTKNLEAAVRAERKLWMLSMPFDDEAEAVLTKSLNQMTAEFNRRSCAASSVY